MLREMIREEILREFWGKDPRAAARRNIHNILAPLPLEIRNRIGRDLERAKDAESLQGKYLAFYKHFKQYPVAESIFNADPDLLGRIAGGVVKDYTWGGSNPRQENAAAVKELIDAADSYFDETGIKWFSGTCYRGLVMLANRFMKHVDKESFEKSKEAPGWFSDPVGRFRGESTLYPMTSNYYQFTERKSLSPAFFISFSASRDTAKRYTEAGSAGFGYWADYVKTHGGKEIGIINPLFECEVSRGSKAVIDPRVRTTSIQRDMNEGLDEIIACPYIDNSITIRRIFIPYEELEEAMQAFGKTEKPLVKSYRKKLDERLILTYVEGDDLVIDLRR